jgi:hypothetical protein
MKFHKTILDNGDLLITADNEARAWLKEYLGETGSAYLWPELVREFLTYYYPFLRLAEPEELAALTSSPILLETTNTGGDLADPRAWWYPNYQVENELAILKDTGRLVMTLAQSYLEEGRYGTA